MSSTAEDWARIPLIAIDRLFESDQTTDASRVIEEFARQMKTNESCFSEIPLLNVAHCEALEAGALARYRCMVQDVFDPELFLGAYEVRDGTTRENKLLTALHRDVIDCASNCEVDFESPSNRTMDRQTLYCVPIPGEADWVKLNAYAERYQGNRPPLGPNQTAAIKRPHSVANGDDSVVKETAVSMETENTVVGSDDNTVESTLDSRAVKRAKNEPRSDNSSSSSLPDLNFPLPSEKGPACLVKIYDLSLELKVCDVIEVVGVLSVDAVMVEFPPPADCGDALLSAESVMDCVEERAAHHPPPSLVPRLHALSVRRLAHNNPLLVARGAAQKVAVNSAAMAECREQLVAVLERALSGDRLAGEYTLCHLVSCVYARRNVVALGKFGINLSGCRPGEYPGRVYDLIARLVTKSHLLRMSLSSMNSVRCVPRKDYTANRLLAGLLQLSARTHLVLDETALEPGQLDANGLANLTALGNVVSWQKVDYDFNFHTQPFHTDISVLVLSEGKSILKCDVQVPLLPSVGPVASIDDTFRGIDEYLTPALLAEIRVYLTTAQALEYTLSDTMQKTVEEDFVSMRRSDPQNLSVDDFHILLTLARLLSLTYGQTSLTTETWQAAKQMEADRKLRLSAAL